jgi:hypothetical protein
MNANASARATFWLLHENVLRLIPFAQQSDDASCIPIADELFQHEPFQRPAGIFEEVLAQPHAREHVIRDGFGEPARVVTLAQDRIESDCVKVHDLVRVARLPQPRVEALEDGVAEGSRPRMCENSEDLHAEPR